jgi:hypothetical protein
MASMTWLVRTIVVGGGAFPIEFLTTLNMFDRSKIKASVRGWDKAGSTKDDSAYTAGVLMHAMNDKTYVVEHVARGRWSALEREQKIKLYAQLDSKLCKNYQIVIEQEPGSGGLESVESSIRNLAGYRVIKDKVTGSSCGSSSTLSECPRTSAYPPIPGHIAASHCSATKRLARDEAADGGELRQAARAAALRRKD